MIGFPVAAGLGYFGKWRWLGLTWLLDLTVLGTAGLFAWREDGLFLMLGIVPVVAVSLGYLAGMAVGRWRTGRWPRDMAVAQLQRLRHGIDPAGEEIVYWQIETRALSVQLVRLFLTIVIVVFIVMAVLFGFLSRRDFSAGVVIAAIGSGALVALFLVVVLGILFNRLRRAFVLTRSGYVSALTDPRLFAGALALGGAGIGSGQPGATGAALSAAAMRGEHHDWETVADARYDPVHSRIAIRLKRLGWFGRDTIFCHPEDFATASAWVARHVAAAAARQAGPAAGRA